MKKNAYLVFLILISGAVLLAQENSAKIETKLQKNSPSKINDAQSSIKVLNNTSAVTYDFTTGDGSQFYGDSTAAVEVAPGVWAMIAGDTDGSGVIDAADRSSTWNDRNQSGYLNSDVNMSGVTDAADRSTTWNNRNKSTAVPN